MPPNQASEVPILGLDLQSSESPEEEKVRNGRDDDRPGVEQEDNPQNSGAGGDSGRRTPPTPGYETSFGNEKEDGSGNEFFQVSAVEPPKDTSTFDDIPCYLYSNGGENYFIPQPTDCSSVQRCSDPVRTVEIHAPPGKIADPIPIVGEWAAKQCIEWSGRYQGAIQLVRVRNYRYEYRCCW